MPHDSQINNDPMSSMYGMFTYMKPSKNQPFM